MFCRGFVVGLSRRSLASRNSCSAVICTGAGALFNTCASERDQSQRTAHACKCVIIVVNIVVIVGLASNDVWLCVVVFVVVVVVP